MKLGFFTALSIFLAIQPVTARFCSLNAIECTYDSGRRCAKWCPQVDCGCADFKDGYGNLQSSKCITEAEWLGRHKCG
ncbi:hypothetical protein CDEST_15304 [Colletotrichum destructivum]|uniref:TIL domain-containing protein n=1 Tax=Colletotrichum destructivum TaxID=34406 RepID=A0AAX4J4L3_9PEZI|nr:hypothetical protein CDEST_15304 [Colletotrichum destructivum]